MAGSAKYPPDGAVHNGKRKTGHANNMLQTFIGIFIGMVLKDYISR